MIITRFLNYPMRVFGVCLFFSSASILFSGVLNNLYSLDREKKEMSVQSQLLQTQIQDLNQKLKRVKEASFVERQALDHLDLASEEDLVFVFAE